MPLNHEPIALERLTRATAWGACAVIAVTFVVRLATGVGQEPLWLVHPIAEYTALLLRDPAALRAALVLDNLFLVLYSTVFVALGVVLIRRGASRVLVWLVSLLFGSVGLLDLLENLHFLVMLSQAEQGLALSAAQIDAQVVESMFKFHLSYLGLFLLGVALPRRTPGERWLARLCCYVQLPVGFLIQVTPPAIAVPLAFVRFGFYVIALILVGWVFGKPEGLAPPRASSVPA